VKGLGAGAKVGITALVIAAIGYFAFKFVSKGIKGEEGYEVWALFHDATGLVDKSRVQVAGLTIGEIEARRLQGSYARVDIKIKPDTTLWSNAAIYKKSASLLGEFYLEIDPGTPESPDPLNPKQLVKNYPLKDCFAETHKENCNQITNVIEAITTTDVLTQINETLPVLRDILKDIQALTSGPMRDIANEVKGGIAKNAEAAERLLNHIDQIAVDVKGITGGPANKDLRDSMANIRQITEDVKKLLGTGEGQVNSTADKIKDQLDKFSVTLDKFNKSLDNVADVTDTVAKGHGTVGRLLKDETIADNITDITEDAGSFIRTITRLQTIVGIREEWHFFVADPSFASTNFKTYLTLKLQPRPDKYYLIELVDDPRGYNTYSHTLSASSVNGGPAAVTNTDTLVRTSQFRFSFMFAKRVEYGGVGLTGRVGIKESTGGLGADIDFWDQRITLTIDLFDFLAENNPRLKVWGAIEFFKHMWLVAGLDDLLNGPGSQRVPGVTCLPATPNTFCQDGRTFFFGLQLTFNDEDLKALLTVGGSALAGAAK
jgi:phospholipid/cholesterol/gamma-HCH transport system substrate-binding protein